MAYFQGTSVNVREGSGGLGNVYISYSLPEMLTDPLNGWEKEPTKKL